MPSIASDYTGFQAETDRLRDLLNSTTSLSPAHRKFIAEIAALRLSILIENTLAVVCCKVACGAQYIDGTTPLLIARQRNIPAAISAMRTLSRATPLRHLAWNDGRRVRGNLEYVVDPADPIFTQLTKHAAFLTELRHIRNHIAHKNPASAKDFVKVVRRYYGAKVRGVTVGNLLVSPRVSTPPLFQRHVVSARVLMKDLARA